MLAENQYAFLEDLILKAESLMHLQGRPQQTKTIKADEPRYRGERRNIKTRKRKVMNTERSSRQRRDRCKSTASLSERRSPIQMVSRKSSSPLAAHFPKREGMSTRDINAAFEYGDFGLEDATSMDSTTEFYAEYAWTKCIGHQDAVR